MYVGIKAGKRENVETRVEPPSHVNLQSQVDLQSLEIQAELQTETLNNILNELTILNNHFKGLNKNFKKLNNNHSHMERAIRSQPIILPVQQGVQPIILPVQQDVEPTMFQTQQSVQPSKNLLANILEKIDLEKGLKTFEAIRSLFLNTSVDENEDKKDNKKERKKEDKE